MLIYSLLKLHPETFFVLDSLSMQYLTMFFVLDSSLSRLHGNTSQLTRNKMLKQKQISWTNVEMEMMDCIEFAINGGKLLTRK